MTLTASVVIASRGRGDLLARCLCSLEFQTLPAQEVIIVGDAAAMAVAARWSGRVGAIPYDRPNISVARNIGWQAARGDIVAFIDDDAVAEPNWLSGLVAGLSQPRVQMAGGFVRGPNGISFQWRGERVDAALGVHVLDLPDDRISVLDSQPGAAVGVMGTNFALRRGALTALGGFDAAIPYYLDETELCLRLSNRHARVAVVPSAQVHHGLAPNAWRRGRVPRSLGPLGQSLGYVLAKHAGAADRARGRARAVTHWRGRLDRLLVEGWLEPRDIARLLAGLTDGMADGAARRGPDPRDLVQGAVTAPIPAFGARAPRGAAWLSAGPFTAARQRAAAAAMAEQGQVVTVMTLSRSTLFHRVWFMPPGIWEHRGGLWGRSQRDDPVFRPWRRSDRLAREKAMRALSRDPEKAIQIPDQQG